jgi:hypothetical protein
MENPRTAMMVAVRFTSVTVARPSWIAHRIKGFASAAGPMYQAAYMVVIISTVINKNKATANQSQYSSGLGDPMKRPIPGGINYYSLSS